MTWSREAGSEPWRVGVLFSQSGVMAVIEETQLRATLLAIDEINQAGGVNGRELVPLVYDPGSEPGAYALCAKRLMIEDGVTMIFGCYTSSSRKAVLPVVERLNGLLWYPTLYEGFECSPNVIYARRRAQPEQRGALLLPRRDLWAALLFHRLGLRLSAREQPRHARPAAPPWRRGRRRDLSRSARQSRRFPPGHAPDQGRRRRCHLLHRGRRYSPSISIRLCSMPASIPR